jgi:regulator of sigma E protease
MHLETILTNAYTLIVVLLLFGVTIFIHELGHFLVARWCGMVVDTFSIGFGPAIWQRKINGVVYKIGLLPFGGYVALPQMDPGGENAPAKEGERRDLPRVSPGRKILVALAGVTGNMILAVLLAYIVYWGGKSFAPPEGEVVIGYVETNSAAYATGLRIGDLVREVGGKTVRDWESFVLAAALSPEPDLKVSHATGEERVLRIPTDEFLGTRYIAGVMPLNYCYVLKVQPGSSAASAGLKSGDKMLVLNGIRLFSREHLMDVVNQHAGQTIPLVVEREGREEHLTVTPAYDEALGRARIGIEFNQLDVKKPWAQIKSHTMLIVSLLKSLVTPRESKAAAGAVGGPVAIITMFWFYVQSSFIMALWFTCLVNVNLAVINLLPLPVLDGGHIMISLWEIITRRPVSYRVVSFVWNATAVLLLAVFALLTWRDVQRFVGVRKAKPPAEAEAVLETNAPAVTE